MPFSSHVAAGRVLVSQPHSAFAQMLMSICHSLIKNSVTEILSGVLSEYSIENPRGCDFIYKCVYSAIECTGAREY
jgi:hypothetical protein